MLSAMAMIEHVHEPCMAWHGMANKPLDPNSISRRKLTKHRKAKQDKDLASETDKGKRRPMPTNSRSDAPRVEMIGPPSTAHCHNPRPHSCVSTFIRMGLPQQLQILIKNAPIFFPQTPHV